MKTTTTLKNSIYALIIVLTLSVFISCNDEIKNELVGTWKHEFIEIAYNDGNIETKKQFIDEWYFSFQSDGKFISMVGDESVESKFTIKNGIVYINHSNRLKECFNFIVNENNLRLSLVNQNNLGYEFSYLLSKEQ